MWTTADLCDQFPGDEKGATLQVAQPLLRSYGGASAFCGPIATVQVQDDNTSVRLRLQEAGNGRVLVVDGVNLYNLSNLAEERFLPVGVLVNSPAFSPDGQLLATGSADVAIRLWRLRDSEQVAEVMEHTAGVWNIAFSPDGQRLASGSLDGTVRLWRVEGENLQAQITLPGHTGPV